MPNPFRYFNSSPEVIRLTVMMYIRYPLSRRQVEDLLFERGIDIRHEIVRFWWNRFGPMFAAEIRKRRIHHLQAKPFSCHGSNGVNWRPERRNFGSFGDWFALDCQHRAKDSTL